MSNSTRRFISAKSDPSTAVLRTATYEGREHLVVPVIALIGDSVIRPMHSKGPEFVPAAELAVAPAQWNGRYVVPNHPHDGLDSANDPATLSANRYGQIFNARFEDNKLKFDAYIDPVRAEEVGAGWVVEDFKASRMVEISVGAWVTLEQVDGVAPNGEVYQYRWRGLISDHLAVGLDGSKGACSVDMGCGAMRANTAKECTSMIPAHIVQLLLRDAALGQSDIELREQLSKALRSTEPGFDWVIEVFSKRGGGSVIYMAMPEDRMLYLKRSFTTDNGDITLGDDRTEVKAETAWVPAVEGADATASLTTTATTTTTPTPVAACKCQTTEGVAATGSTETTEGAPAMSDAAAVTPVTPATPAATVAATVSDTIKALVGRLIACEASPFTAANESELTTWSESVLKNLDETYTKLANPALAAAPVAAAAAAGVPEDPKVAEQRWLSTAPPSVRAMYTRFQAAEAQHRASLVASINSLQGNSAFTIEQLNAKPTEELELLAKALRANSAVDFSPRALSSANGSAGESDEYPAPPDVYGLAAKPVKSSTIVQ